MAPPLIHRAIVSLIHIAKRSTVYITRSLAPKRITSGSKHDQSRTDRLAVASHKLLAGDCSTIFILTSNTRILYMSIKNGGVIPVTITKTLLCNNNDLAK